MLIEDELDTLFPERHRIFVCSPTPPRHGQRARWSARMPARRLLLAIGPEGGWNDFEIALLEAHGFQSAGMGPRTLRTDTACIALLALVHDAMALSST